MARKAGSALIVAFITWSWCFQLTEADAEIALVSEGGTQVKAFEV
jgi:hypothetical protein